MPSLTSVPIAMLPEHANVWLRFPRLISCSGDHLEVHEYRTSDASAATVHSLSLAAYSKESPPLVGARRGANIVHGCDICGSVLACGLADGRALVVRLDAAMSPGGAPPPSAVRELVGHTKVVGFLRLSSDASKLFTSCFDKTVRLWSVDTASCLQVVKAGTPVLQLALLAHGPNEAEPRAVMGCGDGTLRLWDPNCQKASKALATLRFTHKEYVGELRVAADGSRMLSCDRSGVLQLWRRDEKLGFVPDSDAVPTRDFDRYWRVELLQIGLVGITRLGGVDLWPWGSRAPHPLVADTLGSSLLEVPADSHGLVVVDDSAAPAASPATIHVAFIGMRQVASGATDTTGATGRGELEMHSFSCAPPATGGAAEAVDPAESEPAESEPAAPRAEWCELAAAEGVPLSAPLVHQLSRMEAVAQKTGIELSEATVRAFLRRYASKAS
jgi:hypothetical protein